MSGKLNRVIVSALTAFVAVSTVYAVSWPGFECGMGIGGWLTNYKRFNVLPEEWRLKITEGDLEHFDTYITASDIANIRSMGFDHVRLGFDQIVLEEAPGRYRERTFRKIDEFIGWCRAEKLNVVLNLHKAVGNYCDIEEEKKLLDDDSLQKRFIALWLEVERRYHDMPGLAFEILNEVRDVVSLCREHGIPYCVWNYLSTPNDGNRFSLVDDDTRKILSDELLRACLGRD